MTKLQCETVKDAKYLKIANLGVVLQKWFLQNFLRLFCHCASSKCVLHGIVVYKETRAVVQETTLHQVINAVNSAFIFKDSCANDQCSAKSNSSRTSRATHRDRGRTGWSRALERRRRESCGRLYAVDSTRCESTLPRLDHGKTCR